MFWNQIKLKSQKEFSLTSQAIYIFVGKFVQLGLQFIVPVLLVRIFTQKEYGQYQEALFYVLLIVPILRFHFTNSLYHFYPIKKKDSEKSELISQTFFILLCISFIFFILIYFFQNQLQILLNSDIVFSSIVPIAIIISLTVSSYLLENIFIIEKKSRFVLLFFSVDSIIRIILLISLIFYYKTIDAALLALILHGGARFLFLTIYLILNFKISIFKIKLLNIKTQLKYVLPMGLTEIIGTIGKNVDKIILIYFLTEQDFAIYTIGNLSIPFIAMMYTSIGNVIMQELSKYSIEKEYLKTLKLWKKMIIKNATITFPVVLFFFIQADYLITFLFTNEYLESANVFRIFILILFIQMLGYGYILRAYAETGDILKANLIKTCFAIIFGIFMIQYYGIIGAAITYFLSFSINAIYQLVKTKKLLNVSFFNFLPFKDFGKIFLISLVPLVIVVMINQLSLHSFQTLLFSGSIYFLIIYLLFTRLKYLEPITFQQIISFIKSDT